MMRGSNMGILPYGLILLVTWGLGHIRTIATPLDRRKATREVTWGLFASQRTKSLYPCNRLASQAWKLGVRT